MVILRILNGKCTSSIHVRRRLIILYLLLSPLLLACLLFIVLIAWSFRNDGRVARLMAWDWVRVKVKCIGGFEIGLFIDLYSINTIKVGFSLFDSLVNIMKSGFAHFSRPIFRFFYIYSDNCCYHDHFLEIFTGFCSTFIFISLILCSFIKSFCNRYRIILSFIVYQ